MYNTQLYTNFFQSTLLQEERLEKKGRKKRVQFFQSTLLQEERLEPCTVETIFLAFNPRSYKRSDGRCTAGVVCAYNFQSTLLQEERLYLSWYPFT